ncbi:MAG: hypothetical protein A3K19_06945 [Lentisphaerae bacterium RIFOXYB12_FULL_65_16]|nr:MAG: hypothetical protein A3K18_22700 [Lentisphaerae bacterium RIFOXYA12_64_32]OGV93187.1 MAG: hypothetical protein A3K19_06945 [Lentisphaerae bacterium RIFOXYB12_FULL_65_16]
MSSVNILVTADVCPHAKLEASFLGAGGVKLIAPAQPFIDRADLVIGNLEVALCDEETPIPKCGPNLRVSPKAAAKLKELGFGLLTLANNHTMDEGIPGLERTLAELRSQKIPHCGAGLTHEDACQPAVVSVKGKSVAVFNFAEGEYAQAQGNGPGAARLDPFWSENRVQRARGKYDIIIVVIHAGNEYQPIPSLVTAAFCRRMADAGADAVIAHHAHIPQGMEYRHGVPVCFSLGNFLFGNEFGGHTVAWPGAWYLVSVAELDFGDAGTTLRLHPFKQMPDLSLAELSPKGRAAFDRYLVRCNEILADPVLHQRYWEQEARDLFKNLKPALADAAKKLNSENEEEAYRAATLLYGLVHCDAHHETLERGLRLIYERRFADAPEIVQGLAELRALIKECFVEG